MPKKQYSISILYWISNKFYTSTYRNKNIFQISALSAYCLFHARARIIHESPNRRQVLHKFSIPDPYVANHSNYQVLFPVPDSRLLLSKVRTRDIDTRALPAKSNRLFAPVLCPEFSHLETTIAELHTYKHPEIYIYIID